MKSSVVLPPPQRVDVARAAAAQPPAAPLLIAVVTETYPPEVNGVAMTIGRMIDGLVRRGHRVQLVRPRQHRAEAARDTDSVREVLVAGVQLPRYAGLRMGVPAAGMLRRLWQCERPDVAHVVTEGPLGRSAVGAAHRLRIPVCSDFHTNFHSYSRHYGVGLLQPLVSAYLRKLHNRTACTFVPTRELQVQLASEGYVGLEVVARGVDTRLFTPERRSVELRRRWGVSDRDLVVLHVGRLAPEKNLPAVFSAFDAIHDRVPRSRLVLVGDGPNRSALERQFLQHHFAGMRRGEDLAAHYASGDIFLFPSLTETYGNVTIEAMASGLAVVAFDYAAAREHMVHGATGLLAPFADTAAFVQTAADLALDEPLRAKLRTGARATAKGIDWTEVVDEFAAALRRVVAAGRT